MTTPDPYGPPAPAPLDRARAVAMAAVLSALADPVRLQVFQAVRDHGPDGATLRDVLAPGGDAAVVREALARLEAVGLIRLRSDHPGRRYVVDQWTVATFDRILDAQARSSAPSDDRSLS